MASPMVTLSREQFYLLLQRAQIKAENPNAVDDAVVRIVSNVEWDHLNACAEQYARLCKALIDGGVDKDTIELLIGGGPGIDAEISDVDSSNALSNEQHANASRQTLSTQTHSGSPHQASIASLTTTFRRCVVANGRFPSSTSSDTEVCNDASSIAKERIIASIKQFENNYERRSIQITGISAHTTLKDIATIIRGGAILNMYIRQHEHTAHATFVDAGAAERFVHHARENDVYLRDRRIEVTWDKKQYYLSAHIAYQIYHRDATRNLLIQQPRADMTAENIRNDLEHIHRLQVVSITTVDGKILITTNGVGHAMTARTCMRSQLRYQGSRIAYAPDECDQGLPPVLRKERGMQPPKLKETIQNSAQNRFQLLSFDEHESESESESETSETDSE